MEGLPRVRRHTVLVPLALRSLSDHVAGSFYGVLYTIYLIQDLHLTPFLLGVVVSAGGVGSLVGSFFASKVIARLGFGPALIWTATGASIVGVLTPLAGGPLLPATLVVFLPPLHADAPQTIGGRARAPPPHGGPGYQQARGDRRDQDCRQADSRLVQQAAERDAVGLVDDAAGE